MIKLMRLKQLTFIFFLLTVAGIVQAAGVSVQTLDGEKGGLSDHLTKGKVNLVMVWTTYCHICRRQYPIISEFHNKYKDGKAVVLGISLDGFEQPEKVGKYRAEQSHSFPSVLAQSEDFGELYEKTTGTPFTGTPTYVVFGKDGGLIAYLNGPVTAKALDGLMAD